ncbi:MAG TPA: cytochrome ubiquinol oxidase subunit I, partial [Vicinamibacterales bacterium]
LTTSVVVLAVGARYLLARKYEVEARTMMRMGAGMVAIAAPMQLLIGDLHGLNTLEHQPVKVAAMEAHWGGAGGPVDFVVFAWPDEEAETNRFALTIPYLGSLILTHTLEEYVPGLKDFPPEERPPVALVFFAFRLMLLIGLILIAHGIVAAVLWWRGRLFTSPRFLRWSSRAWPLGFVAILAGWIVTESGRQPYTVQGLLLTRDAVSPVAAGSVLWSLAAFVIIYLVVFSVGIYYINRLINRGPTGAAVEPAPGPEGLPNRPLSTAQQPLSEAESAGTAR